MTKFSKFLLLATALLSTVGCAKDSTQSTNNPTGRLVTITATAEQHESPEQRKGDTRTSLSDGQILWTAGDQIRVMKADSPIHNFNKCTLQAGAGTKNGTFEIPEWPDAVIWAIYPASIYNLASNSFLYVILPETQTFSVDSFSNGSNPMVANSKQGGKVLNFKNLCGAIRIQVNGLPEHTLSSIRLTLPAEISDGQIASVAGPFEIPMPYDVATGTLTPLPEGQKKEIQLVDINTPLSFDAQGFTLVVPAGVYPSGCVFTLTDSNGGVMSVTSRDTFTVERSRVTPLACLMYAPGWLNFPDANFRSWLVNNHQMKLNATGTDIDVSDASNKQKFSSITSLSPAGMEITSLKGIENFKALASLDCSNNTLSSFDISPLTSLRTLKCNNNKIYGLDLKANTAITILDCGSNTLSSLDVSPLTSLGTLKCNNNKIQELNLRNNTAITILDCGSNLLSSLDVSPLTSLGTLKCNNNKIQELNLSNNTAITILDCGSNLLSSLDVSLLTSLKTLNCNNNTIQELNLSNNTAITILDCSNNKITKLLFDATTNFIEFNCSVNHLSNIELGGNSRLMTNGSKSSIYVGRQTDFSSLQEIQVKLYVNSMQIIYPLQETTTFEGRNYNALQLLANETPRIGSYYYDDNSFSYILNTQKNCIGIIYEVSDTGGKILGLQVPAANWKGSGNAAGALKTMANSITSVGLWKSTNDNGFYNMSFTKSFLVEKLKEPATEFPAYAWVGMEIHGHEDGHWDEWGGDVWYIPAISDLNVLYAAWNGGSGAVNDAKRNEFNSRLRAVGSSDLVPKEYCSSTWSIGESAKMNLVTVKAFDTSQSYDKDSRLPFLVRIIRDFEY